MSGQGFLFFPLNKKKRQMRHNIIPDSVYKIKSCVPKDGEVVPLKELVETVKYLIKEVERLSNEVEEQTTV